MTSRCQRSCRPGRSATAGETTPKDSTVASAVTLHSYSCPANAEVEFYEIAGGGHTWPGDKSVSCQ